MFINMIYNTPCTIVMHTNPYLSIHSDQQVLWLDVPVHNAQVMQARETHQHLLHDALDDLHSQAACVP